MAKHYVGETGTDLILDTGILIGSATEKFILYRKGDQSTVGSWSASLFDSYSEIAGLTGTYLLKHTFTVTDLDVPGEWRFQSYVAAVDGTWYGEMVKLQIYDRFE